MQNESIRIWRPFDLHDFRPVDEAEALVAIPGPERLRHHSWQGHNKCLEAFRREAERALFAIHAAEPQAESAAVAPDVVGDEVLPHYALGGQTRSRPRARPFVPGRLHASST